MSENIVTQAGNQVDRATLVRQAFWLEYLTLAWMTVEAVVAIGSGVVANSLTLVAFGIDSFIELASACVLVWRLNVELRRGEAFAERAEQTASKIGGGLLFALAAYVVASAAWKIVDRRGRGVFGNWFHTKCLCYINHVFSIATKVASCERIGQPSAEGRCSRRHYLWLARIRVGFFF